MEAGCFVWILDPEGVTNPARFTFLRAAMKLTCTAFEEGASIPTKYTCDGPDVSPSLSWTGIPEEAGSLVLIVDDPDAPAGTWVHWVLVDVDPSSPGLPEDVPPDPRPEVGGVHGENDFGNLGYGGPCPPDGEHRYFFRLYALEGTLDLEPGVGRAEVDAALEGRILDRCELMGRYER